MGVMIRLACSCEVAAPLAAPGPFRPASERSAGSDPGADDCLQAGDCKDRSQYRPVPGSQHGAGRLHGRERNIGLPPIMWLARLIRAVLPPSAGKLPLRVAVPLADEAGARGIAHTRHRSSGGRRRRCSGVERDACDASRVETSGIEHHGHGAVLLVCAVARRVSQHGENGGAALQKNFSKGESRYGGGNLDYNRNVWRSTLPMGIAATSGLTEWGAELRQTAVAVTI